MQNTLTIMHYILNIYLKITPIVVVFKLSSEIAFSYPTQLVYVVVCMMGSPCDHSFEPLFASW